MTESGTFDIFRFDPDSDTAPRMQTFAIEIAPTDRMLLDVLMQL